MDDPASWGDLPDAAPEDGMSLALSGGGFRATLYHCGALIRLNELGLLPKIDQIGSVSGGSITSGRLAAMWKRLEFDEVGVAANLGPLVVEPLREFCGRNQDRRVFRRWLAWPFADVGSKLASVYEDMTEGQHFEDLPDRPEFVFKATNFQTGSMVRFSQSRIAELQLGAVDRPKGLRIATAIAASSAYPPFLSPVRVDTSHCTWREYDGHHLGAEKAFSGMLVLADGGVHDNLGLRGALRFKTALVSDAGAPFAFDIERKTPLLYQMRRTIDIISEQGRRARAELLRNREETGVNTVAYWRIDRSVDRANLKDELPVPNSAMLRLARMRTRLNRFSPREQGELINWGYASCDYAVRSKPAIACDAPAPKWPVPEMRLDAD